MSGEIFAYIAEHFPTLVLIVIAAWTAWHVRGWKGEADQKVDTVTRRLEEHERGCEERGKQVDARLNRIERDVSWIRGWMEPKQ